MSKAKRITIALVLVLAIAGAIAFVGMIRHGFSARDKPSTIEAFLAHRMRHWAVPAKARALKNPYADSAEAVAGGRAHFADHCALCHGNDGRGITEMGQNLYPKAPDMWSRETQSLSDGEILFIIKNGVRLTGMPAWGHETGDDDRENWHLVSFIRHLPWVTPKEIEEMKALNPVSPMEMKESEAEKQFLEGSGQSASPSHEHGKE